VADIASMPTIVRTLPMKEALKFERREEKLLPFPRFIRRMVETCILAATVVSIALAVGLLGYHFIGRLNWIDSLLNASMILTGMGPVNPMTSAAAKVFASVYALFSGVVFLSSVGFILSPIFHRMMHKFHLDPDDDKKSSKAAAPSRKK
jgi:hypothetical protein